MPIAFFVLAAFVITYVVGIGTFLVLQPVDLQWAAELVLKFGPSLAGLLTVGIVAGRSGVIDLLRRCLRWRAPPLLYVAAIMLQPAIVVVALVAHGHASDLRAIPLGDAAAVLAIQLGLQVFLGGGLGEELGWRGFMLPHLARRHGPLLASVLVAVAWLAWHLPGYVLFDKGGSDPILPFAVIVFPFSLVLAWAYFRSGESLVLPIILHGSINATFYALEILLPDVLASPGFQPAFDWTLAACWCALAALLLAHDARGLGKRAERTEVDPPQ